MLISLRPCVFALISAKLSQFGLFVFYGTGVDVGVSVGGSGVSVIGDGVLVGVAGNVSVALGVDVSVINGKGVIEGTAVCVEVGEGGNVDVGSVRVAVGRRVRVATGSAVAGLSRVGNTAPNVGVATTKVTCGMTCVATGGRVGVRSGVKPPTPGSSPRIHNRLNPRI